MIFLLLGIIFILLIVVVGLIIGGNNSEVELSTAQSNSDFWEKSATFWRGECIKLRSGLFQE